jgi:hypothetical protein
MAEYAKLPNKEWQVPSAVTDEVHRIGWLNELCDEGLAWYRSQRGTRDNNAALEVLSGRDTTNRPSADYRSKVAPNRLKRNIREVTGTMAKLRPMWGYHSDNTAYKPMAGMLNKVTKAVYLEGFFDRNIRDALNYAAATGRGWIRPIYRRDMYGTGQGNIKLLTYGAPCVLPYQLPSDNDWQSAYACTYLDEMPIAMAHGMFPSFQHRLFANSSRYWYANDGVRGAATGNIWQRMFGRIKRPAGETALPDLLVPIRYTYVIDLSINTTKSVIPMGEPNSSWFYEVPYVGMDIPVGLDGNGHMLHRKANENDARLYPTRRLIISSVDCIPYDGPSFDWHGMFPGVSFCPDYWPWEPNGFSMVHDGFELNESIKEVYRGCMDKVRAGMRPSIAYDTNAIARKDAASIDPMMPDGRFGYDGNAVDAAHPPFQPSMPPEVMKIDPIWIQFAQLLETQLDNQMALGEIMNLAKVRGVGSMDELEKALEVSGPIVEEMSRSMEPPMRDLGVMVKFLVFQYFNNSRVMQYVGLDGITPEVFDYDPTSIIPSHLAGEDPSRPSAHSALHRARVLAGNMRFFILPNTLHEMAQMSMKLALLQMKKANVKMDSQTIGEAFNVPNYGTIDGATVIDRWKREQEMDIEQAGRMELVKQGVAATIQAMSGQDGSGPPTQSIPPGGTGPGKPTPEGRPSTDAKPAKIESKDGGTRSTIASS